MMTLIKGMLLLDQHPLFKVSQFWKNEQTYLCVTSHPCALGTLVPVSVSYISCPKFIQDQSKEENTEKNTFDRLYPFIINVIR